MERSYRRAAGFSGTILMEFLGILLVIAFYFSTYFPRYIEIMLAFGIFLYLIVELYFVLNAEYPKVYSLPLITALYLPILAFFTFIIFIISQYYLRAPFIIWLLLIITPLIIMSFLIKKGFIIFGGNQKKFIAQNDLQKSDFSDIIVFLAGFTVIALTIYYFIYVGGGNLFLGADGTGYLSAIESFAAGGKDIVNYGSNLVGQASFAYTSSTMTFDAFFFQLLYPAVSPINIYILLSGVMGGSFIYFAWFLSKHISNYRWRVLFIVFSTLGFSAIGFIWLVNSYLKLPIGIYTPPFFQGTYFLTYNGGNIGIEGAQNDLFFKAIWHGLAYTTMIEFLYFLKVKPKGRKPLLYLFLTIFEYWPIGILLFVSYALYLATVKIRTISMAKLLYYWVPFVLLLYFSLDAIGFKKIEIPYIKTTFFLNPIGLIPSELLSFVIMFFSFFLVVYADIRNSIHYLRVSRVEYDLFAILIFSSLFVSFSVVLNSGIMDTYIFGMVLSLLFMLFFWRYASDSMVKNNNVIKVRLTNVNMKGNIRRVTLGLLIAIIIMAPTILYVEQPFTNVLEINSAAGIYVNSTEIEVANIMNSVIPQNKVTMVPLNLWYLGPLSNRQILTTVSERNPNTYNSQVFFNEAFYLQPFTVNFSSNSSLNKIHSFSNNGNYELTTNKSVSSTPVLLVKREAYANVYINVNEQATLSNLSMSFSVYPTNVSPQPRDVLGIVLTLSNGQRISFQNNSRTQGGLPVIFINLTANTWNNLSFNLKNISKNLGFQNYYVTSVTLAGGIDSVIYWGNFELNPTIGYSNKDLLSSITGFNIGYILTAQPNLFINMLIEINKIVLTVHYQNFNLYRVSI